MVSKTDISKYRCPFCRKELESKYLTTNKFDKTLHRINYIIFYSFLILLII